MLKFLSFFLALNAAPDLEQDLLRDFTVETWLVPVQVLREAKELRIYAYDLGDCTLYRHEFVIHANDAIIDGVLPNGAAASATVRAELEALIPNTFADVGSSMCFEPHHFLAWFDANGETIATAQVCFECEGFELSYSDASLRKSLNWPFPAIQLQVNMHKLRLLFNTAGVPISLEKSCKHTAELAEEWRSATQQLCLLKKQLNTIKGVLSPVERNQIRRFAPNENGCVRLPSEIRLGGGHAAPK